MKIFDVESGWTLEGVATDRLARALLDPIKRKNGVPAYQIRGTLWELAPLSWIGTVAGIRLVAVRD